MVRDDMSPPLTWEVGTALEWVGGHVLTEHPGPSLVLTVRSTSFSLVLLVRNLHHPTSGVVFLMELY